VCVRAGVHCIRVLNILINNIDASVPQNFTSMYRSVKSFHFITAKVWVCVCVCVCVACVVCLSVCVLCEWCVCICVFVFGVLRASAFHVRRVCLCLSNSNNHRDVLFVCLCVSVMFRVC